MRCGWVTILAFAFALAATGCAKEKATPIVSPVSRVKVVRRLPDTRQPDIGYLMDPSELDAYRSVPGAEVLREIIRVGARALDWVDLLQKDIAPLERVQIWRRTDRIGREPSPDKPLIFNPDTIVESYRQALSDAPSAVVAAIQSTDSLPATPPRGLSVKDIVAAVREVHTIYSRASRWLVLYQWRSSMGKAKHDLRDWLKLNHERSALITRTEHWPSLSKRERTHFISQLSEACPLVEGVSAVECQTLHSDLNDPKYGGAARQWLDAVLARGQQEYNLMFGVREAHADVHVSTNGSIHQIEMPTYGLDSDIFTWIQERVKEAWSFNDAAGKPAVAVKLYYSDYSDGGSLKVEWEKGALPHVNGVAGDIITMDSNSPRWLEHTQTVMRHEFGHVLGFPDCYTEFWDQELKSFVYYSLDPADGMCALSGQFLNRHRDALLRGYF